MPKKTKRAYEATLDATTGLYDGQTIRLRMVEEVTRARRYRYPVSLVVVVFEGAEAQQAEERLHQLAELLERHVRTVDIIARCEQDSLVLLLPHTAADGARQLGERVYDMATVMQLPAGLGGRPVTVRVGITTVPMDYEGNAAALVDMAKESLRKAAWKGSYRAVIPLPLGEGGQIQ